MTKTKLKYDINFIDCVSTLAPIMPQLIFKKTTKEGSTEKMVSIKANDVTRSLLYTLDAPESYFNFTGNNFALLDFSKFATYFDTFRPKDESKAPVLSTEQDSDGEPQFVYINSQVSPAEIKQALANIDVISKPIFENIDSGSADVDFEFTESQFTELKKMVSMIGADSCSYKIDGEVVTVTLFSKLTSDRFVQQYKTTVPAKEPFELTTTAKSITLIPAGAYRITIDKEGLVVYHQHREDDIKLTLYTSEI